MSLAPGTRLGPYEIQSALGAGGMGEVYKARDTRLDRMVALKVLPAHLAADPEFHERFEREARTISALDHPHICALYDVGDQDGTAFLVMQFLDGETLADRLRRGALPVGEALQVATEIADALDKAHRHGITHRDLKPANIFLARSGRHSGRAVAKLLDFGLAKHGPGPASALAGASALPTAPRLTARGTILGTFQYMAPEQLEGQEADTRTDLFAFGATLYEILTGKKAFEGKSQASLIGAIMNAEPPPISTVQPLTPPALDRLVKRCLAKDRDERWQTAADLLAELKWIAEEGSRITAMPALRRGGVRIRLAWAFVGVLAVGLVAATIALVALGRRIGGDTNATAIRFSLPVQSDQRGVSFALSPDGRHLAFVDGTNPPRLYMRSIDALEARALAGTDGAGFPFWSADSRFIGFFARGGLRKIAVAGGPPQMICQVTRGIGGTWNRDDVILFGAQGGLFRVPAAGGAASVVLERTPGAPLRWPQFLPDGRRFLYFLYNGGDKTVDTGIYASSLDTKESKQVMASDYMPRPVRQPPAATVAVK